MHLNRKEKKGSYRCMYDAIAGDVNNKRELIGLLDFVNTVIGGKVDMSSSQLCFLQLPKDQGLEDLNENTGSF